MDVFYHNHKNAVRPLCKFLRLFHIYKIHTYQAEINNMRNTLRQSKSPPEFKKYLLWNVKCVMNLGSKYVIYHAINYVQQIKTWRKCILLKINLPRFCANKLVVKLSKPFTTSSGICIKTLKSLPLNDGIAK